MKTISLCGVAFVCLLAGCITQQVVNEKLVLPKNTVLPIRSSHVNINGAVYRQFTTNLYLGDEGTDKTPIQKTPFSIEFNGKIMNALQSDTTVPNGVKVIESMGFTMSSSNARTLTSRGVNYLTLEYLAHLRLDPKHIMDSKVLRARFTVNTDSAKWVKNELLEAGLLQLGYDSAFWSNLLDAYKSDKGDAERIPVSWSLNPVDESQLFDSRASYIGETFIFNGFRATGKQYGMKASVFNDVWYYPSMDFKMGEKWSTFDKTVCIDPNVDAFIGLPTTESDAVWKIIQDDICAGNTTSTCDYSRATIDKMTAFEISLATSKVALSQVAPPKFESHVKLQGSDVIKKDKDGKFLRYGLVQNSDIPSTVCNRNNIILGRWFFTKVEMTMWVKTPKDVVFSFSNIEKENKSQKDAAAAGLGLLIIIGIILVVIVIAAAGVAVYKKVSGGSGEGNYDSAGLDGANDTSMTGKP